MTTRRWTAILGALLALCAAACQGPGSGEGGGSEVTRADLALVAADLRDALDVVVGFAPELGNDPYIEAGRVIADQLQELSLSGGPISIPGLQEFLEQNRQGLETAIAAALMARGREETVARARAAAAVAGLRIVLRSVGRIVELVERQDALAAST